MSSEPDHAIELPKIAAVEASVEGVASGGGSGETVVDLRGVPDLVVVDRSGESGGAFRGGFTHAATWQVITKRAIDIVGSALLLALLLPILLVTAVSIRVTSPGPALYLQRRVGRDGRAFNMLKFRSMRVDSHGGRDELLRLNEATGPVFKIKRDPRLTRVGRAIRRLSVDELPQLINVLRGEMSLVGPRPPLPEEYTTYGPRERQRLSVTPGLTCIWQVSGRSDLDFETWVEMDLRYISTWTLRQDLKLLLLTIPAVLTGRGAY